MLRSTQSAPATIKQFRQKSATAYRSHPAGGPQTSGVGHRRKAQSAMPSHLGPIKEITIA